MRVRISYGVELEDVPSELSQLCKKSIDKLSKSLHKIDKCVQDFRESGDDYKTLDLINCKIEEARSEMAQVDSALIDV